ncbi:MAG: hypothetical protein K5Q00_06120 [Gammaproteobacteria bacterium]|nr:hypothetical protein [Gammaproteobacteria bacterium]
MLSESNFGHRSTATQAENKVNSLASALTNFSSKGMKTLQEGGKTIVRQAKAHPAAAVTIAMLAGIALHRLFSKRK